MVTLLRTSLLAFLLWPNQISATSTPLIGQVDMNSASRQIPCTQRSPDEPDPETALIAYRDQKLKELQALQKQVEAGELSQEVFIRLRHALEDDLRQKIETQQKEMAQKKEFIGKMKLLIEEDIAIASAQIAQQKGLTLVIRKNEYTYGAIDITADVIVATAKLQKKRPCPYPYRRSEHGM